MGPYGFNDKNTAIKLRDMVRTTVQEELGRPSFLPSLSGLSFINKTGQIIPPYGVVYIQAGSAFLGTRGQPITVWAITRSQVSTDGEEFAPIVNGPQEVAVDGRGHSQETEWQLIRYSGASQPAGIYSPSTSSPMELVYQNGQSGAKWRLIGPVAVAADIGLFQRVDLSGGGGVSVVVGNTVEEYDSSTQGAIEVTVTDANDAALIGTVIDVFIIGGSVGAGSQIIAFALDSVVSGSTIYYAVESTCVEISGDGSP